MCGSSSSAQQHPYLKPKELEQEANNLLEESTRIMFQSKYCLPLYINTILFNFLTIDPFVFFYLLEYPNWWPQSWFHWAHWSAFDLVYHRSSWSH
jgi:hypothetical protein